jgi:hypothetical protein
MSGKMRVMMITLYPSPTVTLVLSLVTVFPIRRHVVSRSRFFNEGTEFHQKITNGKTLTFSSTKQTVICHLQNDRQLRAFVFQVGKQTKKPRKKHTGVGIESKKAHQIRYNIS